MEIGNTLEKVVKVIDFEMFRFMLKGKLDSIREDVFFERAIGLTSDKILMKLVYLNMRKIEKKWTSTLRDWAAIAQKILINYELDLATSPEGDDEVGVKITIWLYCQKWKSRLRMNQKLVNFLVSLFKKE